MGALAWSAYGIVHLVAANGVTAALDAAGTLTLLVLRSWGLRAQTEQRWRIVTHLILTCSALGLTALSMLSGQSAAMSSWFFVCLPVFAAYQEGVRAAIGWSLACIALLVVVHGSEAVLVIAPEFVPRGLELLAGQVTMVLVLLSFAVVARRATEAQLRLVEAQQQVVVEQARALAAQTAELVGARDAALAAANAQRQFVAHISHEIRTPLNGVLGAAQLIDQAELPPSARELVETINAGGAALTQLVGEILELSRLDGGGLEIAAEPFDLVECIEDSLQIFAVQAAEADTELTYHLRADLPDRILSDRGRLRQVLVNLLANAMRFGAGSPVSLRVGYRDGALAVAIADRGPGVPADRLPRIFEPFVSEGAPGTGPGTGLGLAICQRLVAVAGGRIWAESQPGKGSAFHFTWPAPALPPVDVARAGATLVGKSVVVIEPRQETRAMLQALVIRLGAGCRAFDDASSAGPWLAGQVACDVVILGDGCASPVSQAVPVVRLVPVGLAVGPEPAEAVELQHPVRREALREALERALARGPAGRKRRPSTPMPLAVGALRVLVVDDNAMNRLVTVRLLEHLGHTPHAVEGGQAALEALERTPYEVVLMDVHMPGVDGLQATALIRKSSAVTRQPKIVALTANAYVEDRQRCLEAGMDDFLSKPVGLEKLASTLGRLSAG